MTEGGVLVVICRALFGVAEIRFLTMRRVIAEGGFMNDIHADLSRIFADAASYFIAKKGARTTADQCLWKHRYDEKLGEATAILQRVPDAEFLQLLDLFFANDDTPRVILVLLYQHLAARFVKAGRKNE